MINSIPMYIACIEATDHQTEPRLAKLQTLGNITQAAVEAGRLCDWNEDVRAIFSRVHP